MSDAPATTLPAQPDAVPAPSLPQQTPAAPASPTVQAEQPEHADTDALPALVTAFRVLQMHHARVLNHESVARGLNATDTRLVFFLAASDDAGVTPKQAGEYLELSTGAMTSLVDRLERHGHIERRPNPADRRSILIHLTPSGSAVAQQIGGVFSAAFREVVPPAAQAALASQLLHIGEALDRHSRAAG